MASIFTKIISGEIPSYKIAEDDDFLAFLDVFPLAKGHVLIVPKKEVDNIFNLDLESYQGLMNFAYKIAPAIEKAIPCKRIGMAVIGLEVPHAHVHLLPLQTVEDINFSNPKIKLRADDFLDIQRKIMTELEGKKST